MSSENDKIAVTYSTNGKTTDFKHKENPGTLLHNEAIHHKNNKTNKISIFKNLFILSIAYMFLFTAFNSLQNLQSSLNAEDGIGTISLSLFYASFLLSSLFLPPFIISRFGCKYTLCSTNVAYFTFIIANFKAEWHYFTLPISAVIAGVSTAPFWTSIGTYINILGKQLEHITDGEHSAITARFFGIFSFFFSFGHILGNLISFYILELEEKDNNGTNDVSMCGKNFCPSPSDLNHTNHTNLLRPPNHQIYLLCGIYLGFSILTFILILFILDNLKEQGQIKAKLVSLRTLTKTIQHLKDPKQAILIPYSMYIGLEVGFISSDFTGAFVSCTWGISKIGFVMMTYGITSCISSISFGTLIKFTGRIPCFTLAFIIHISLLLVMLTWTPTLEMTYIFFIIAPIWGMADGIVLPQGFALYGTLFAHNKESGFSNKCLWEGIGFTIAFACSSFVCTVIKIYILLLFVSLSSICYFLVEYLHYLKQKHEN